MIKAPAISSTPSTNKVGSSIPPKPSKVCHPRDVVAGHGSQDSDETTLTKKQKQYDTQDVVPDLIEKLSTARMEVLQNSNGPSLVFERDPHLRLRRTLTPRSKLSTGIKKYSEAQFVIANSTGKRTTLNFTAPVIGINTHGDSSTQIHEFYMDAYIFGATESQAKLRLVALHGISPTASRERWHQIGQRIQSNPVLSKAIRFVALDWHSIDRGDNYQEEFLTMLPKHYFTTPTDPNDVEDKLSQWDSDSDSDSNQSRRRKMADLFDHTSSNCPRTFSEAAIVWRSIIEEGLGWGPSSGKSFIPCFKSWSGGVGMEVLFQTATEKQNGSKNDDDASTEDNHFRDYIDGAIIMHPACFQSQENVKVALSENLPVLAVWAKDDPLVPYSLSQRLLVHDDVKLITYENGGHGSFDGTIDGQPNFDDEILDWLHRRF